MPPPSALVSSLSLSLLSCVVCVSLVLLILARVCCVCCLCCLCERASQFTQCARSLSQHSPQHCLNSLALTLSPDIVSSDLLSSLTSSPCLLSQASRRTPHVASHASPSRRLLSLVCRALSHASCFFFCLSCRTALVCLSSLSLASSSCTADELWREIRALPALELSPETRLTRLLAHRADDPFAPFFHFLLPVSSLSFFYSSIRCNS